jgi:hypothetical protein
VPLVARRTVTTSGCSRDLGDRPARVARGLKRSSNAIGVTGVRGTSNAPLGSVPRLTPAWLMLGISLSWCGAPRFVYTARVRGARDLSCPLEQVGGYQAQGGVVVACGCNQWIEYACFYRENVCLRQSSPAQIPDQGIDRPSAVVESGAYVPTACVPPADPKAAWEH